MWDEEVGHHDNSGKETRKSDVNNHNAEFINIHIEIIH